MKQDQHVAVMQQEIEVTVDGVSVRVALGSTILEAARAAGAYVPTLCHLEGVNEIGACRVCVVEVEGAGQLVAACNTQVAAGMVVRTNTPRVQEARRMNVQLLLVAHDAQCPTCVRSGNCSLQKRAHDLGILGNEFPKVIARQFWSGHAPLQRDAGKCIKCGRCVAVCEKVQATGVWEFDHMNHVRVAGGVPFSESMCTLCGQCVTHCPTAALSERDDTIPMRAALADPATTTVVQVAPAVRTAWAESFGIAPNVATPGRLAAALRRLGFDYVFDTSFSADLTIMEEGSELLERLGHASDYAWPLFTSCCPGWVRYAKAQWPQYAAQLSSAKSPQQMFGAVAKTWFAQRAGIDPQQIFSVSVMPCVAKKHECALETMDAAGTGHDVDLSLTTREFARMIRAAGINIEALPEEPFDDPLGTGTGAAVIFGATGGVMEAALRSAHFLATGENPAPDAFREVRGGFGWREAEFNLADTTLRVAVASGLSNARALLEALDAGTVRYDFVEIMACPGGCAGGGGQPIHEGRECALDRGAVLYSLDAKAHVRFSHENPSVAALYEEFLEAPLSPKAHELLHSDHEDWHMPHA